MRATQFYPQAKVFGNGIMPTDIKQGALGNCYFLAVLAGLAEVPDRVGSRFITQELNPSGIFLVTFFVNGVITPVVVDDYFPCYKGEPVFSKTHRNELWVMLLEKAWAKLHGSYERIEAGFAENVLRDLTGAPTEILETEDDQNEDKLW